MLSPYRGLWNRFTLENPLFEVKQKSAEKRQHLALQLVIVTISSLAYIKSFLER